MNKYVLKFTKEGYIKYISHLDLQKMFNRSFRMANIELKHSEGFNPHPKMSIVQPLSLGYSSKCELVEVETVEHISADEITNRLNDVLPSGVKILSCIEYFDKKTLASEVNLCEYRIFIPYEIDNISLNKTIRLYLEQETIDVIKVSKKNKTSKTVDIKPMIKKIEGLILGDFVVLKTLLDSGSSSNLSPELVISSFIDFSGFNVNRYDIEVERIGIYFSNNFQL